MEKRTLFKLLLLSIILNICILPANSQARYGQLNNQNIVNLNTGKLNQAYYILNNYYLDTLNFSAITDKLLATLVK